jgi:2-oxoglutarate ferredoxin oxidoreductase subunit delta
MTLEVNKSWCKGCYICVQFCPHKVLDLDEMGKVYIKAAQKCTACGLCELRCPDFCLTVRKGTQGGTEK